jgi:hypothetical protein
MTEPPRLYTANWSSALAAQAVQPVRISLGCPKAAHDAPSIGALMPYGMLRKPRQTHRNSSGSTASA